MRLKSMIFLCFAVFTSLISQAAFALQAGDNVVYGGIAYMMPSSSLGPVTNSNPLYNGATPGVTANVQNSATVIVSGWHMFTDNIAAELTLGIPPISKTNITAPSAAPFQTTEMNNALSTKVWFPSLIAKYLFREPKDAFRPYVGLGFDYTWFTGVTPHTQYSTAQAFAGNGADLSSSWNPVYNIGAIYSVDDRWSINVGLSYVPLKTNVTFHGNPGFGVNTATAKLSIDPLDLTLKVGYKF